MSTVLRDFDERHYFINRPAIHGVGGGYDGVRVFYDAGALLRLALDGESFWLLALGNANHDKFGRFMTFAVVFASKARRKQTLK